MNAHYMIWIDLIGLFKPNLGVLQTPELGFVDPLGLSSGLPNVYSDLNNSWGQVNPRLWQTVSDVESHRHAMTYQNFALLVAWWLCMRLAMEEEVIDRPDTVRIPSNFRNSYPVDNWLGWVNLVLEASPGDALNMQAVDGLRMKVSPQFRRCVAAGTHATIDLLLKRLGLNWNNIEEKHFPEIAHSLNHAARKTQNAGTGNSLPNGMLTTKPVTNASADTVPAQWMQFVKKPFGKFDPLTSKNPINVHLRWSDADPNIDPESHPFAALVSIFRSHKAPEISNSKTPASNHSALDAVWHSRPNANQSQFIKFQSNSLGAWLAWSAKSNPKLTTSFQNAWTYSQKSKHLLPPLLLYLLAWAGSSYIADKAPDWLQSIPQTKTSVGNLGSPMNAPPRKIWSLEERANELGAAFTQYNATKTSHATSRFVNTGRPPVQHTQDQSPHVLSTMVVGVDWLKGQLTTEIDNEDSTQSNTGCWVLWIPEKDLHHQPMLDLLDNWAAVGHVCIQTRSGESLMEQGIVTTDWLLLPDTFDINEVEETDGIERTIPLPVRFHSPHPVVLSLLSGHIDGTGADFGARCELAWVVGSACQRGDLEGEVYVSLKVTVPDNWASAK